MVLFPKNKDLHTPKEWRNNFDIVPSNILPDGTNKYFRLVPGYALTLSGTEEGKKILLTITVLQETKLVDGFTTRIVEERELVNGEIAEISRNYFGLDKTNNDVYYFGEDVDMYKNGNVASHDGSWESGVKGARFGLAIPGTIKAGDRFYQENAPGIAMDRIEIQTDKFKIKTKAGTFSHCLKTEETSPLEPNNKEYKVYTPGIGLVKDGALTLIKHEQK